MTSTEIVRSWKDQEFFGSLSAKERVFLPPNPVGLVELTDEDLLSIEGGSVSATVLECVATAVTAAIAGAFLSWCISQLACAKG